MADSSPEELARNAQRGATSSFEELVARFEGPLYHFLLLRVGRQAIAEELAQETFLRAWRKLHLYDPEQRFSTWLFTLGKRIAASHTRRRASVADKTVEAPPTEPLLERGFADDPAELAQEREQGLRLWETASRVLKVEQRSALWLRYAEDLSAEDIARILGRRASTVRVMLFRAREILAVHLEPPGPTPRNRENGRDVHTLLAQNGNGASR